MEKVKRFINMTIHTQGCNLNCDYCYLRYYKYKNEKEIRALRYPLETVLKACSVQRLGVCHIIIIGDGETLLPVDITDIVCGLIENGHYVTIITNGTITERIKEIVEKLKDKNMVSHLEFSLSLHYLELKRLGLLSVFAENVRYLKENHVSVRLNFILGPSVLGMADEVKAYCRERLGMKTSVGIARKDVNGSNELLADCPEEEYFKIGDSFESYLFEQQKQRYKQRCYINEEKKFCYAGKWSFCLDLTIGLYSQCAGIDRLEYNFFERLEEPLVLEPVGKTCKMPYCACGFADSHNLIPEGCHYGWQNNPMNEELWCITEEMCHAKYADLSLTNEEYTDEEKEHCNLVNKEYEYKRGISVLIAVEFRDGNYEKVIELADAFLKGELDEREIHVLDVILKYGYALLRTGRYEQALCLATCYDDLNYNADYCLMMGFIYMQNGQLEDAIRLLQEAPVKYSYMEKGTNSFLPYYNFGVIYECTGQTESAVTYYKKCGDYRKAMERLAVLGQSEKG